MEGGGEGWRDLGTSGIVGATGCHVEGVVVGGPWRTRGVGRGKKESEHQPGFTPGWCSFQACVPGCQAE